MSESEEKVNWLKLPDDEPLFRTETVLGGYLEIRIAETIGNKPDLNGNDSKPLPPYSRFLPKLYFVRDGYSLELESLQAPSLIHADYFNRGFGLLNSIDYEGSPAHSEILAAAFVSTQCNGQNSSRTIDIPYNSVVEMNNGSGRQNEVIGVFTSCEGISLGRALQLIYQSDELFFSQEERNDMLPWIIADGLYAIQQLHNHGWIHRHPHKDNFTINDALCVRIIDLTLAKRIKDRGLRTDPNDPLQYDTQLFFSSVAAGISGRHMYLDEEILAEQLMKSSLHPLSDEERNRRFHEFGKRLFMAHFHSLLQEHAQQLHIAVEDITPNVIRTMYEDAKTAINDCPKMETPTLKDIISLSGKHKRVSIRTFN